LAVELWIAIFFITRETIIPAGHSGYARPFEIFVTRINKTTFAITVSRAIYARFDGRVQQDEIQQYRESEYGHGGVRQKHNTDVVIILTFICGTISIISKSAP